MTIPGVDYAWSHPGGAAVQRAGYSFACRYSSNDATKDISRQEADDLAAHGVWTVVVRETTANRARAGRAAGIADAKAAVARATTAGMPSGRPLYFAIDYDAPVDDKPEICDYFRGVASVIGLARTGGYGGYDQLKWLIDAGLIRWVWQTAAWSRGRLLPGRHIYQYARTVTLNGVSCDINEALTADYGQWMPGKLPTPEDRNDMADITQAQMVQIAKLCAGETAAFKNPNLEPKGPDLRQRIVNAEANSKAAADGVKALAAKPAVVALTDAQVAAVADRLASNPAFVTALAGAIGKDLAARMQA
jgi:hypothetical protein